MKTSTCTVSRRWGLRTLPARPPIVRALNDPRQYDFHCARLEPGHRICGLPSSKTSIDSTLPSAFLRLKTCLPAYDGALSCRPELRKSPREDAVFSTTTWSIMPPSIPCGPLCVPVSEAHDSIDAMSVCGPREASCFLTRILTSTHQAASQFVGIVQCGGHKCCLPEEEDQKLTHIADVRLDRSGFTAGQRRIKVKLCAEGKG